MRFRHVAEGDRTSEDCEMMTEAEDADVYLDNLE